MSAGCAVCGAAAPDLAVEETMVRSNVRAFSGEQFAVWRCRRCASLHARDEVDLAHYYAKYPFHSLPDDWRMRAMYANQWSRLTSAGVRPNDSILDYGCGAGDFIRYLRARGASDVAGYDEYSTPFADASVLERRYRCVISQDVIEHVADPRALLDRFDRLVEPGGVIAIGTPNAAAIDLRRAEKYIHALHLPYHRHILSKQALIDAGAARHWHLEHYYRTQYVNTRVPFLNSPFLSYYAKLLDNSLDVFVEEPQLAVLLILGPWTLFLGFFGSLFADETGVMAVFRKP
jgi:2-polyprenyl-3-methyl-5-hydroxy-6-metoxy-1,4-benzoquinol methylase